MASQFKKRLNTIEATMHVFVSCETICLIRDYFKACYEVEQKPDDLDARLEEMRWLEGQMSDDNPSNIVRYQELLKEPAIWLTVMIDDAEKHAERGPIGTRLHKIIADLYRRHVPDARRYFELKSQETHEADL